jgi:hypothetical protein
MRLASGVYKITVASGGSGYSSPPAVVVSGGGGTGATAAAQMAGTAVQAVLVGAPGSGYTSAPGVTISGGGGTGAAATASVLAYSGSNVISIFKGRGNDLYGVDGLGRGFRWDGDTEYLEPLGIQKPLSAPAIAVTTGGSSGGVRSVAIINGGAGYYAPPSVTFVGGGVTDGSTLHARARARIAGARVVGMTVDDRGGHYTSPPQIVFSGGQGSGATLSVGVSGAVSGVSLLASGSGYTTNALATGSSSSGLVTVPNHGLSGGSGIVFTSLSGGTDLTVNTQYYAVSVSSSQFAVATASTGSPLSLTADFTGQVVIPPPAVQFSTAQGLTQAIAFASLNAEGGLSGGVVAAAGTGATTTGVTAVIVGGGGTGAQLSVQMAYSVVTVTATGGTNYVAAPAIGFRPDSGGARVLAAVSAGTISSVTVLAGGQYAAPPEAVFEPLEAKAIAVVTQPMLGRYKCCIRYLDDTTVPQRGPIPSSISDFQEVEVASESSAFQWTWSNAAAEARAHRVELWRTTADQELVLYRVAILDKVNGILPNSYTDTLSDNDLLDPSRTDFGIMPIVLPSGQLNAKRFTPPPEKCAVACVFQDRAWYTADTTRESPNSLWYSEIDEPESVPVVNEIILQENANDSDAIVGVIPFGAALLVLQHRHLYKLQYVAQPIIDASIMLVAYRGVLNSRCVDVYDGVAFVVDAFGLYAFDGRAAEPLSVPVDNYWRDGVIDFSKSSVFHVRVNPLDRVVRFYYCQAGDGTYPARALCFCLSTRAWWEETYDQIHTATAPALMLGGARVLTAGAGKFMKQVPGAVDTGASSVPYDYRTGNFPLVTERSRSVGVVYTPSQNELQVRAHYNGSTQPRPNAVAAERGDGFTVSQGSTAAVLNMAGDRSQLGAAPGFARASFAGRVDDRSAGGDRHAALAIGGAKTGSDAVRIHSVVMEGVTQ